MKKLNNSRYQQLLAWAAVACAALGFGLAASAQTNTLTTLAPDSNKDLGLYLSGDAGSSFLPDTDTSRFGFPGKLSARRGLRTDIAPGYNFLATDKFTLGGELETGLIYNHLSSVSKAGSSVTFRGDYYQVPMLGNLVFKAHPTPWCAPYVGAGAGGDYSWAGIHSPGFAGFQTSSSEIDPAAQALGGVRFKVSARCDVGVGYKFLAAFPAEGKYIGTHSVGASFSMRF